MSLLLLLCLGLTLCLSGCSTDSSNSGADAAAPPSDGDITDAGPTDGSDDGGASDGDGLTPNESAILAVPQTEAWQLPGLNGAVHVVRVEAGVPHLYAEDRNDLGLALGFILARDRYFVMDLQRRLGLGTVASLLGDLALPTDIESRLIGMPFVADRMVQNLSPDLSSYIQSFVDGINVYIDAVNAELAPPPSELQVAAGILGATSPGELMEPFTVRDVAAMTAVIMYQTTFDTEDIARSAAAITHEDLFTGVPHAELRRQGFFEDILKDVTPLFPYSSTPGLGLNGVAPEVAGSAASERDEGARSWSPATSRMLRGLTVRLKAVERRLLRHHREGIGSNAWAVAGSHTEDGYTLVAGDGHLPLAVPAVTYQVGLNTTVFGEGDIHQTGILLAQLPVLGVGTNGKIAWSQVNPYADTVDWYREEIQLGEDGLPSTSTFRGEQRPLIRVDETYEVATVLALGSEGGDQVLPRFTTFDGRWITDIEGIEVTPENEADVLGTVVHLMDRRVVPSDLDDDGVITAISLDYTAFDTTRFVDAADEMGRAENAAELRQAIGGLLGSGLYTAGGDGEGNILFSSYQAVPCRSYLPKTPDGHWTTGAHPRFLLDGTQYGGFTITSDAGRAVEGADDPYACVIPFDVMPQAYTPDPGFVVAANNDPANLSTDGQLDDGDWYIGGPWNSTRAATIAQRLQEGIDSDTVDIDYMAEVQASRASRLGEVFVPHILDALTLAASNAAPAGEPVTAADRLALLYGRDSTRLVSAKDRLTEWRDSGYDTPSGVDTFYDTPNDADRKASVATMIFNVWLRQFALHVWGDEGVDESWTIAREQFTIVSMARLLEERGNMDPSPNSIHPDTGESIFFDLLETPELETSHEMLVMALSASLDYLTAPPSGENQGGFGTDDMDAWLWGMRHQARFESLLASFLGDNPQFSFLLDRFAITTDTLPLVEGLDQGDPRANLKWFPRGGDQWAADAANPGLYGDGFTHGNGPVMRMVIALKDGDVKGQNIIPGGQSGLTNSPHFADQAALWLENQTFPLRYHPTHVAEGATGRIHLTGGDIVSRESDIE